MHRTRALRALLAATALLAPVLAVAAPASTTPAAAAARPEAAAYVPPPIDWGRCSDATLRQDKAQCGYLTVPLDHADPTGPTVQLAVSRVLHTKSFRGAVFTNPGGPGGSGLVYSALGQYVPKGAGLHYDWYGVDPRGVGASKPALTCDPAYLKPTRQPYEATTAKRLDYWVQRAQAYSAACAASPTAYLLPHMRTTDTVADFEDLRTAIGQSQITWYGFSYGTEIGQVYATEHPSSIKAMILDGVIDANQNWVDTADAQVRAFGKAFSKFFAWIGRHDRVYHLGRSRQQVQARFERLLKRLARKPAGRMGPAELEDAILGAGYYNGVWADDASRLSAAIVGGNTRPLQQLAAGSYPRGAAGDNSYAAFLATSCTDSPWPSDVATWVADAQAGAAETAPYVSWSNWFYSLPCRTWPVAADAKIFQVSGAALSAPVLLTAEQYDAATPFSGALATRALFPTSALVEGVGGTSHAVTLSGIACTDDTIAALLKDGTLPKRRGGTRADKKCPGLAPPAAASDRASAGRPAAAPLRGGPMLP